MAGSKVLALILGGGQGSRLHPLTESRSQPAVPIKIPKLPSPAPKPIWVRDGHGQRHRPTNELEKTRREPKKQELFM